MKKKFLKLDHTNGTLLWAIESFIWNSVYFNKIGKDFGSPFVYFIAAQYYISPGTSLFRGLFLQSVWDPRIEISIFFFALKRTSIIAFEGSLYICRMRNILLQVNFAGFISVFNFIFPTDCEFFTRILFYMFPA